MEPKNIENHKFLPSGFWKGFYCYNNSSVKHKMSISLKFSNKRVSGSGTDDLGSFKWNGKYDLNNFKINMTKIYPTHIIHYKGDIDENGIWGIWDNGEIKGGFHIWPGDIDQLFEIYSELMIKELEQLKKNKKS